VKEVKGKKHPAHMHPQFTMESNRGKRRGRVNQSCLSRSKKKGGGVRGELGVWGGQKHLAVLRQVIRKKGGDDTPWAHQISRKKRKKNSRYKNRRREYRTRERKLGRGGRFLECGGSGCEKKGGGFVVGPSLVKSCGLLDKHCRVRVSGTCWGGLGERGWVLKGGEGKLAAQERAQGLSWGGGHTFVNVRDAMVGYKESIFLVQKKRAG